LYGRGKQFVPYIKSAVEANTAAELQTPWPNCSLLAAARLSLL